MNISSTVNNNIKGFREYGEISVHKGQKSILDWGPRAALHLKQVRFCHGNQCRGSGTLPEITAINTVHRAILKCKLKLYRARKKPNMNIIQKRRWKNVMRTDKSKFENHFGKHARCILWAKEERDQM